LKEKKKNTLKFTESLEKNYEFTKIQQNGEDIEYHKKIGSEYASLFTLRDGINQHYSCLKIDITCEQVNRFLDLFVLKEK